MITEDEKNFHALDLNACDLLNDFEVFCKLPEQSINRHDTVGWSEWIKLLEFKKRNREDNYLEYSFIGRRFVLKYSVMLFNDYLIFKTYEIKVDKNNYPANQLNHIPELDIFYGLDDKIVFRDQIVHPNGTHKITQFCTRYIEEVAKIIRRSQVINELLNEKQ
jgi:hypothetical protein